MKCCKYWVYCSNNHFTKYIHFTPFSIKRSNSAQMQALSNNLPQWWRDVVRATEKHANSKKAISPLVMAFSNHSCKLNNFGETRRGTFFVYILYSIECLFWPRHAIRNIFAIEKLIGKRKFSVVAKCISRELKLECIRPYFGKTHRGNSPS